jgi:hypothetical protein
LKIKDFFDKLRRCLENSVGMHSTVLELGRAAALPVPALPSAGPLGGQENIIDF